MKNMFQNDANMLCFSLELSINLLFDNVLFRTNELKKNCIKKNDYSKIYCLSLQAQQIELNHVDSL